MLRKRSYDSSRKSSSSARRVKGYGVRRFRKAYRQQSYSRPTPSSLTVIPTYRIKRSTDVGYMTCTGRDAQSVFAIQFNEAGEGKSVKSWMQFANNGAAVDLPSTGAGVNPCGIGAGFRFNLPNFLNTVMGDNPIAKCFEAFRIENIQLVIEPTNMGGAMSNIGGQSPSIYYHVSDDNWDPPGDVQEMLVRQDCRSWTPDAGHPLVISFKPKVAQPLFKYTDAVAGPQFGFGAPRISPWIDCNDDLVSDDVAHYGVRMFFDNLCGTRGSGQQWRIYATATIALKEPRA